MPEETRVPDLNQHHVQWPDSIGEGYVQVVMFTFQCIYNDIIYYPLTICLQCFYVQDIPDVNWDDEDTQRGLNTGIREHHMIMASTQASGEHHMILATRLHH